MKRSRRSIQYDPVLLLLGNSSSRLIVVVVAPLLRVGVTLGLDDQRVWQYHQGMRGKRGKEGGAACLFKRSRTLDANPLQPRMYKSSTCVCVCVAVGWDSKGGIVAWDGL